MKLRLLASLSVLMFLVVPSLVLVQATAQDSVAGDYDVEGESSDGVYHGQARISQRGRAVFMQWRLDTGHIVQGFGVILGNQIAASYAVGPVGVSVLYRREGDVLKGEWPDAEGMIFTETLTKQAPGQQAHR